MGTYLVDVQVATKHVLPIRKIFVRLRDKLSYIGHRRFLPPDYPWRKSRDFNGKTENMRAPIECTGEDCLRELENFPSVFGKIGGKKEKMGI